MTFLSKIGQYFLGLKPSCVKRILIACVFAFVLNIAPTRADASTIVVPAGGNLQAAILAAQPGDTIILQAGSVYTGPFTLPYKSGDAFITIQSSALEFLPGDGQRISPAHSALMPKLVSPGFNQAVISTEPYAHHYRFIGIEVSPANANAIINDLIKLGDGSSAQSSLNNVPHDLVLDRCYIHGFPTQEVKRGVAMNSGEASVINSYISDIHGVGYDTQAICGWNGPGPYHIINNYLEASGENVMFGGADPAIPNLVPSDIEIRRNYFFKPLSWKVGDPTYAGYHWTVKNLLELKNARRVTIDGNTFENCWVDAQTGWAILIKSQNQDGGCPWCVSEDVIFSNNVVKNAENGLNILAYDPYHPPPSTSPGMGQVKRLTISNNLWYGIKGMFYQGTDGADSVTLEHNTAVTDNGNTMTLYGRPTTNFNVRNNILLRTGYGIKGDGAGEGSNALQTFCPSYSFAKNVVVAADATQYPSGNFYPASLAQVGFVDASLSDYRLSPSSPYRNSGTDGKDLGVDFDALIAAMGGSGLPAPTPTPTPTPNPTPTPGPTPTPTPSPTPVPSPTPSPTPSPSPTPNPQAGPKVRKAKSRGQNVSNDLASAVGTSSASNDGTLESNLATTDALALFILEIQEAQTQFSLEREIYPSATRIQTELTAALQSALQANSSYLQGDVTGARNQLHESINRLELSDVLISYGSISNPIDAATYFVRQHYLDFFNREPEQAGNEFWVNQLSECGTNAACLEDRRINVSAAFFLSIEFQKTGYFVHRLYKSSYRRVPTRTEFMSDNAVIGRGVVVGTEGWEARLAANKEQFLQSWVQRPIFVSRYAALSNRQFVDTLIFNIAVQISPSERDALVQELANGASRASILVRLADNAVFSSNEFNRAFVLMQYFGYLRRDPDNAGFTFWLNKLNEFGGNYQGADMVKAFLSSQEYRRRFNF